MRGIRMKQDRSYRFVGCRVKKDLYKYLYDNEWYSEKR